MLLVELGQSRCQDTPRRSDRPNSVVSGSSPPCPPQNGSQQGRNYHTTLVLLHPWHSYVNIGMVHKNKERGRRGLLAFHQAQRQSSRTNQPRWTRRAHPSLPSIHRSAIVCDHPAPTAIDVKVRCSHADASRTAPLVRLATACAIGGHRRDLRLLRWGPGWVSVAAEDDDRAFHPH